MKLIILAAAAAALVPSAAFAQAADNGSHNPAVKNSATQQVDSPAKGRNSFTQAQAKARIAKAGYSGVSRLAKDHDGVWQGTAMRDGQRVHVGLDYQGNVSTR